MKVLKNQFTKINHETNGSILARKRDPFVCNYTQLQKKVYTFRFVEYSEGSGPEMNLGGAQYSPTSFGFQGIISVEYS